MTRSQFATCACASEKWIANASAILQHRFEYTPSEARWLGLVRVLTAQIGLELSYAAVLAQQALELPPGSGNVTVGRVRDGIAGVTVDLDRYLSTFAAACSSAMEAGGERRRGRPRPVLSKKVDILERASNYGVDVDLLREGLKIPRRERLEQLDANAEFMRSLRASRR